MNTNSPIKNFLAPMKSGIAAPIVLVLIFAMIIIPLPPLVLDILFILNIVIALVSLMVCIYAKKPLDFSLFPTILLLATLMRLSLNIASTRVILLSGGTGSAGQIIEAFGHFVIGGVFIVGLVVFSILVIINFIVITKGAERISEVSARFTLDSMPGKQMAVDADLNSGQIDQETAGQRRKEISMEAQFHGNMDGASKFVKGDAIAGILILLVNILGGLLVGTLHNDMSALEALDHFVLLSIGDGLVAILPSIIMALATAIIITRVSSETHLADVAGAQLLSDERVPFVVGLIVAAIGSIAAMPNLLFLTVAALLFALSYKIYINKKKASDKEAEDNAKRIEQESVQRQTAIKEMTYNDIDEPKATQIALGNNLLDLASGGAKSALSNAIRGSANQLSKRTGVLISGASIAPDNELGSDEYKISIGGIEIARGEIRARLLLAIPSSPECPPLEDSKPFKEPIYGTDSFLIMEDHQSKAEDLGYEVLTPASVISTHVEMCITDNLDKMIDIDGVQKLIDKTAVTKPKLVEFAMRESNTPSKVLKVLRSLLRERIPVTKFSTILEVMAQNNDSAIPFAGLMANVRKELTPWIISNLVDDPKDLKVIMLSQELTETIANSIANDNTLQLKPEVVNSVTAGLKKNVELMDDFGYPAILLISPQLRDPVYETFGEVVRDLHYIDFWALPKNINLTVASTIGI